MQYPFDTRYSPPAAALEVRLMNSQTHQRTALLPAFVDTGADATLVPLAHLKQISAVAIEKRFLRSQWGERRPIKLYAIRLQFADLILPELRVVGDDRSSEILIGRDALNHLWFLWDGPQLMLEILE